MIETSFFYFSWQKAKFKFSIVFSSYSDVTCIIVVLWECVQSSARHGLIIILLSFHCSPLDPGSIYKNLFIWYLKAQQVWVHGRYVSPENSINKAIQHVLSISFQDKSKTILFFQAILHATDRIDQFWAWK